MDDLATDNPVTAGTDNPLGPATITNGTSSPGGQAQGATPADDLFKGIDPNRLPPEIKAHYDGMLRDYRDKTGRLSETIKAEVAKSTEPWKSKAELYDQIATQEEFVRQWNEYVQKQQTPENAANPAGDPVLSQMKAQIQEMNQKIQLSEMAQITEAFADAVDGKGTKLHPEFDALNQIHIGQLQSGQSAEDFSILRACVELAQGKSPTEKLTNGYKAAKAAYDSIFEAGKKAGMGRLQTKVQNGTNPPTNVAGEVMSVTEKRPKNAHEALAMAKKGVMVSRE